MALTEVVVDFGTSDFTVYEGGILYKEPSCCIVKEGKNGLELLASGYAAINRTSAVSGEVFIRPISAGAVKNNQAAALLVREVLSKTVPKKPFASYRIYVIVASGITPYERRGVEQAFHQAGYRDVVFIECVLSLLPFADKRGSAVAVFGGGTLEVGIVSEKGIVSACSLNLGGQDLTEAIRRKVFDITHLNISSERAEALKLELASLYPTDVKSAETVGRDALDGSVKTAVIRADELYPVVKDCYGKMFQTIESLLTAVLDAKTTEILKRGILLAGGGSKIRGLQDAIAETLKLPSKIIEMPEMAVVRGAAKLVNGNAYRDVIVK